MPTYEGTEHFLNEWRRLRSEERKLFDQAVQKFVEDLKAKRPPRAELGVKRFKSLSGVFEFRWAPDGRALFRYGPTQIEGEPHIIWLRIGGHEIYSER